MTEIDVPDWVVKAADEAGDEFAKTHTMSMYASLADMQRDCVRHMLTAALGAWVVPMAWAGTDFPNWRRHESEQVRKLTRKAQPQHGFITPLYTLRQEKPE